MQIEEFALERYQSLHEHRVRYNLSESGVHPLTLRELLGDQLDEVLDTPLLYAQTNGLDDLRAAIAALHPGAGPENVLVTGGSAEANFIAMWSLLEPGDEVVLMLPNYMQLWGLARGFGATVRPLRLREELGWKPDLDELEALVGPRTQLIAICNPNNPTGAVLSHEELARIAAIADRTGMILYSDEVYRGAERDGVETPTVYGLAERAIAAGGLSKAYGLPGLRLGWLVGPAEVVARGWSHHDYTTITASTVSQVAARHALQPGIREGLLERSRKLINANVPVLERWVADRGGTLTFVPPSAGAMAFLRYGAAIGSTELAERARTELSVLLVAGDCYGMDGYLRLGVGGPAEDLVAGLDLLAGLVDSLSAKAPVTS